MRAKSIVASFWLLAALMLDTLHCFAQQDARSPVLFDEQRTSLPESIEPVPSPIVLHPTVFVGLNAISSFGSDLRIHEEVIRSELKRDPLQRNGNFDLVPNATDADRLGSTNIPMDSWVYAALERLAAMGYIPSQTVAIRPWTRQECLRQVNEVKNILQSQGSQASSADEAYTLLSDLLEELNKTDDETGATLESVYFRFGTIAGPVLADGFHFGQTWWNDFGRPLGRGTSVIAGLSARATHGRFFIYDRQELQQSPGTVALNLSQSQLLNSLDNGPSLGSAIMLDPPSAATSAYTRQRPLELYAGVAFAGNSLSFGKQALYWGPTTIGPLSFSSNAEPTYNLHLVATRPHPLPFIPQFGSYRFDLVFGKLSGHKYPARPYYNGLKLDFTLGSNLEISFTRWSVLWGVGHPITLGSLRKNIFSINSDGCTFNYGDRCDPGDRKSGFDFRLHVPGLRKLVTIYADSYADDEVNPIDAPRRVVWSPGVYFPRLPLVKHMDLRVEMASSEELSEDEGGTRFFINTQYRESNTNKGFLLGNAVGRDGRAIEARSAYWYSSRTRFEVGYRQNKGGTRYLPGGTTITDAFCTTSVAIGRSWSAQFFVQYERFLIPSLTATPQHNESGTLQVTWNPRYLRGSKTF